MEFWNAVIHTALLGTDKQALNAGELGPDLEPLASAITAAVSDKEDRFLQLASLAYNYRQAGAAAIYKEGVSLAKAPPEETGYAGKAAHDTLGDILADSNIPLITYWLRLCAGRHRLVKPEWLPSLLQLGVAEKQIRPYLAFCGGSRGTWLSRLNPDWNYSVSGTTEELWQTGTPEQRRMVLKELRLSNPDLARDWLQQTWASEDVNTRADLLKQLAVGINENDLPFLEGLAGDKSKKLKEEARILLKMIPGSAIVRSFSDVLQKMLVPDKANGFLIRPAGPDDLTLLGTLGIDKLSNRKEYSDDEFIVYQLLKSVPLETLETAWKMGTDGLVRHSSEGTLGPKLLPALVLSVRNFSDKQRALVLARHAKAFYIELLPLLPLAEQEHYSNKYITDDPEGIIQYALKREEPWSLELSAAILRHAAKNPYQYNRAFFTKIIHLLPVALLAELEKPAEADDPQNGNWDQVKDGLIRLLNLKKRTINAFNE